MSVVERIYIGGLDPSRLTAQEVASRLESSIPEGVEIQSTDLVGGDKKFFYVNAVSNDADSTALKKIAKQYNNVAWKRCKLVVQAARPHLLERLAGERMQRQQQDGQEDLQQEAREVRPIPRHLRIRQKFGAEAHQVDTKPCRTEEWSDFCTVVNKLRTKREQHNETLRVKKRNHTNEELLEKKRSFRNRAVHLRWSDESLARDDSGDPFVVNVSSDASVDNEPQDALSTSEDSESDDTESSVSADTSRPMQNGKHSQYVWSDDEESESSVDNSGNDNGVAVNGSVDDNDESVSSESKSENDEKALMHKEHNNSVMAKGTTEHGPLSSRVGTEEFSAAIDFSDSPSSSSDDDTASVGESTEPLLYSADHSQNLDDDVQSNLNVLSSLFPDMAGTKPVAVNGDDNEDYGVAKSAHVQSGRDGGISSANTSTGFGLMQRFDPTKESAKKYIIAEPRKESTDNSKVDDEALPGRLEDGESRRNDDNANGTEPSSDDSISETDNDNKTNDVYEQSRLEDIFREAKSSGNGEAFKMSSMFDDKIEESAEPIAAESFAFGFDLGGDMATRETPVQHDGGLKFSFGVDSREQKEASHVDVEGKTENNVAPTDDTDEKMQDGEEPAGIQRRGLFFPEDTLDGYVNSFFAMNEGSRILEDPRGFLRDDSIKQQWKNERHALTLDWKRKKKYAQSRMQKKMRFR